MNAPSMLDRYRHFKGQILSKSPHTVFCPQSLSCLIRFVATFCLVAIFVWFAAPFRLALCDDGPPHVWISDAPPRMARLIDSGEVKIMVDDAAVRAAQKSAMTLFHIGTQYKLRFGKPTIRRVDAETREASVQVRFTSPSITLQHEIKFSSSYQPEKPWESRLLLHEMDHVAISTDPRLVRILKSLIHVQAKLAVVLPGGDSNDASLTMEAIHAEQAARRESVQKLVQQYYDLLDKQSNQGLSDIENRRDFFLALYSRDDLKSRGFPYFNEIRGTLSNVNLDEVKNHYFIDDPE